MAYNFVENLTDDPQLNALIRQLENQEQDITMATRTVAADILKKMIYNHALMNRYLSEMNERMNVLKNHLRPYTATPNASTE